MIQRTPTNTEGQDADQNDPWPMIGSTPWLPGVCIPTQLWAAVPKNRQQVIEEFMKARGRVIRKERAGSGYVGLVHLKAEKAILCELNPCDIRICVGNESVRHFDTVSVSIDNAGTRKEAMTIFREWLEDLLAVGINEHSANEFIRGR